MKSGDAVCLRSLILFQLLYHGPICGSGTVWATKNGIVDADAVQPEVVKDKDQCKLTHGSTLDLKSTYVLSDLYVF